MERKLLALVPPNSTSPARTHDKGHAYDPSEGAV